MRTCAWMNVQKPNQSPIPDSRDHLFAMRASRNDATFEYKGQGLSFHIYFDNCSILIGFVQWRTNK